jgi:hypothetical protein
MSVGSVKDPLPPKKGGEDTVNKGKGWGEREAVTGKRKREL